jgi:hypothetical protein
MTKKAKFSTITAIIAAIAVMSTMGIIGGARQQVASATILGLDDLNGLVRQGIVDDEDSRGTDDSIIIVPDIALATDVVDDEDSRGTDDSIIIVPDVSWITPEISSRIPDVDSIIVWPDVSI